MGLSFYAREHKHRELNSCSRPESKLHDFVSHLIFLAPYHSERSPIPAKPIRSGLLSWDHLRADASSGSLFCLSAWSFHASGTNCPGKANALKFLDNLVRSHQGEGSFLATSDWKQVQTQRAVALLCIFAVIIVVWFGLGELHGSSPNGPNSGSYF